MARIVDQGDGGEVGSTARSPAATAGGGGGGGGGGIDDVLRSLGQGGAPDLASMMQNPALMNMAQQMMGNGGLENLMRNPAINNMVRRSLLMSGYL